MTTTQQIARHLRQVYFGGNWTSVNLKDQLDKITWQEATTKTGASNTIATLVFHLNYYVKGVSRVLEGGPLDIRDKFSFDHPPIDSPEAWEAFTASVLADGEAFASLVEKLPDTVLPEPFTEEKYGSYHRNLLGIVEHVHYHLGQISLLRKII